MICIRDQTASHFHIIIVGERFPSFPLSSLLLVPFPSSRLSCLLFFCKDRDVLTSCSLSLPLPLTFTLPLFLPLPLSLYPSPSPSLSLLSLDVSYVAAVVSPKLNAVIFCFICCVFMQRVHGCARERVHRSTVDRSVLCCAVTKQSLCIVALGGTSTGKRCRARVSDHLTEDV